MVNGGRNMKYKQGEKMIVEITEVRENSYVLNKIGEVEPMEAKIRRQAAEITRLLAENKKLKEDKAVLNAKIDAYELYGDQHEEEYNQAFNQGAETAWELAKKFVLYGKGCYSDEEVKKIFGFACGPTVLRNYTYKHAAAKVAEWEKTKEIKAGDIVESNNGNGERIAIIDVWPSFDGLHFEGISSNRTLTIDASAKYYTKTGRHIDIDSFLKQIGDEE